MLDKLFSTADVHVRDRFDYWHDIACVKIVDHNAKPLDRRLFNAELRAGTLADIQLVDFTTSAMKVTHTRGHAAHWQRDELFVCRQIAGCLTIEQGGSQAILKAGDFTLLDPRLPYTANFDNGSSLLVVKLPRRAIETRTGSTRNMNALAIDGSRGVSRLTSSFIYTLPSHTGEVGEAAEKLLRNQMLDFVALSLGQSLGRLTPRMTSARSIVFTNVRWALEDRLTDHSADAEAIALAAGVSVRYANEVLASQGTSIMRLLWERRLARCRDALLDDSQAYRTIGDIAWAWGFSDLTHFGRAFRGAYGMLPSEFRKALSARAIRGAGRSH